MRQANATVYRRKSDSHVSLNNVWRATERLSRREKMVLLEKLVRKLRTEESPRKKVPTWEQMYGIGKGIWDIDAQAYVDSLREERF